MDAFEMLYTTRAMRRLRPEPVPEEVLARLLDAAIRAPTGGNRQTFRFVVVRDPAAKKRLQELYLEGARELFGSGYGRAAEGAPAEDVARGERLIASALWLAEHLHEAPVLVMACIPPQGPRPTLIDGASVYPAVWSLQLAARALGLGSALTTIHRFRDPQIKELLGIPQAVTTAALVPIGYPQGRWRVAPRRPLSQFVFSERWGQEYHPPASVKLGEP